MSAVFLFIKANCKFNGYIVFNRFQLGVASNGRKYYIY